MPACIPRPGACVPVSPNFVGFRGRCKGPSFCQEDRRVNGQVRSCLANCGAVSCLYLSHPNKRRSTIHIKCSQLHLVALTWCVAICSYDMEISGAVTCILICYLVRVCVWSLLLRCMALLHIVHLLSSHVTITRRFAQMTAILRWD